MLFLLVTAVPVCHGKHPLSWSGHKKKLPRLWTVKWAAGLWALWWAAGCGAVNCNRAAGLWVVGPWTAMGSLGCGLPGCGPPFSKTLHVHVKCSIFLLGTFITLFWSVIGDQMLLLQSYNKNVSFIIAHGDCVQGNDCVCRPEWRGPNCEQGKRNFVFVLILRYM